MDDRPEHGPDPAIYQVACETILCESSLSRGDPSYLLAGSVSRRSRFENASFAASVFH